MKSWFILSCKAELKKKCEHFENVRNHEEATGKDTENNEKVCNTLDVKNYLFCEEKALTWFLQEANYLV